jgi:hypothetical protein
MTKTAMTEEEMRENEALSKKYVNVLKNVNPKFQQQDIEHLTGRTKSTISESKSNGVFTKHLAKASVKLREETKKIEGDEFQKARIDRNKAQADMMQAICIADIFKKLNVTSLNEVARLAEIGKNEGLFFASSNSYKTLPAKLTIIFDTTNAANLTIGVSSDDAKNTVGVIKQWAKNRRNFSNYLRLNVTEIASAPPTEMIGSIQNGNVIGYAENDGAYYPLTDLGNDLFKNYCALLEDYDGKPCIPSNQKARVIEFFLVELEDQLTPEIETFLDEKLDEYEHEPDDGQLIDDPFEFLDTLIPDAPAGFADAIEYLRLKNA